MSSTQQPQFAVATLYPRSVAWIVRVQGDAAWHQLERVICHSCTFLGGMHSILVPLTQEGKIAPIYKSLLEDYDPDLIVLPPGLSNAPANLPESAYAVLTWEEAKASIGFDPTGVSGEHNPRAYYSYLRSSHSVGVGLVAVGDENESSTSHLALLSCGDVLPQRVMVDEYDGELTISSHGYREDFLHNWIVEGLDRDAVAAALAQDDKNTEPQFKPAPTRLDLRTIINPEHQFPLSGAAAILEACAKSRHPHLSQSFLRLTVPYDNEGHSARQRPITTDRPFYSFVVLVSDEFTIHEAILYWNLRSNGINTAWLSFTMLETEAEDIIAWLSSDFGGKFYSVWRSQFTFSAPIGEEARLDEALEILRHLHKKLHDREESYNVASREDLVFYDRRRPEIRRSHIPVNEEGTHRTFLPPDTEDSTGTFVVELDWPGAVLLPYSSDKFRRHVGCTELAIHVFPKIGSEEREVHSVLLPMLRLSRDRRLRFQSYENKPLRFEVPSVRSLILDAFSSSGVQSIEVSSAARYHLDFLSRCGGLHNAAALLRNPPLPRFWEVLANNTNTNRDYPGWVMDNERRALHHRDLCQLVGIDISEGTTDYFKRDGDVLPKVIQELLDKRLLERGFKLLCRNCSNKDWYAAQQVGQTFICHRCLTEQVIHENPFWLYKLPEVTFRGFQEHMEVPLLALSHLETRAAKYFAWEPDSNITWRTEDGKKQKANIDLLLISDGRLFIGEAKSNDEIETAQFGFYEHLCRHFGVDGVVFATSQHHWNEGTQERIHQLSTWFEGEVITLTRQDLYPSDDQH